MRHLPCHGADILRSRTVQARALKGRPTIITPPLFISTVEIPVADIGRAAAWYRSAPGFQRDWSDEHHALLSASVEDKQIPPPGVRILLVQTEDVVRLGFKNSFNGLRHSVIDFHTPQLEDLHASLLAMGAKVDDLEPAANVWAPRGFGFFDSEGNRLAAFTYAKRP